MNDAESRPAGWQAALWALVAAFSVILFPFLLHLVVRISYRFPMNYNEGWNAMHVSKLLAGEALYARLDGFPLTPLNYPPLSYLFIGGLSYFSGNIVLTGRIVTLLSSTIVAWLIYRIIENLTKQKSAAIFGALFWLALMARLGRYRLVFYDPQILAHTVSLSALYLFSAWRETLTARRLAGLALLCCLALFIKHLVVPVPVVIAIALLFENRRAWRVFAFFGIVFFALMTYASWRYGGDYLFANSVDLVRPVDNARLSREIRRIFYQSYGWVVFPPFFLLLANRWKTRLPYLFYFCLAFAMGAYACRGIGVDINAWFDFFIASAIIFGIFTGDLRIPSQASKSLSEHGEWPARFVFLRLGEGLWREALLYGVLLSAVLPLSARLGSGLSRALDYDRLQRSERAYQRQVELLKSIPGPALFENLLVGLDAGKEFLFDPFNATQMIVSGRIPEALLTDAIARREFGAIVLEFDLHDAVCALNRFAGDGRSVRASVSERWTDTTLKIVADNYELLDKEQVPYRFYVPRKKAAEAAGPCLSESRRSS